MGKAAVVDIDNTLGPFYKAFYKDLKKINATFPAPDQWTSFEIWEGYCSEEQFIDAINSIHFHQDSEEYKPFSEAKGFLNELRQRGYRVIIASHRLPETKGQTERWLARNGLEYDELHLSFDKTTLFSHTNVVVDDAPQTLQKAVEAGLLATGLLFPWNRTYPNNGFKLFQNLNEILDYFLLQA